MRWRSISSTNLVRVPAYVSAFPHRGHRAGNFSSPGPLFDRFSTLPDNKVYLTTQVPMHHHYIKDTDKEKPSSDHALHGSSFLVEARLQAFEAAVVSRTNVHPAAGNVGSRPFSAS